MEYSELLDKACAEEIRSHDVILTTCIAANMKSIVDADVQIEQLIVDEAAMIKEPEVRPK